MEKRIYSSESEFLREYDKTQYERPSVAVDLLVFTIENDELKIVTVKRKEYPYKDSISLPGVFVGINESIDDAVKRGIKEETGLSGIYFEQLYTWGEVDRDPRMRIISVSYMALVPVEKLVLSAGERESEARLYAVSELISEKIPVAFDHKKMIEYGRERIKNKVEYTEIAFEFLKDEFTLPQLQKVYEILLDKPLYKANFRKKMAELIEETDKSTSGDAHRPSKIYRKR